MCSNRRLTAAEALDWGLVSEVVPAESLRRRASRSSPPSGPAADARAIGTTKQLFEHAATASLERAARAGGRSSSRSRVGTDDFREGVTAFLEKRAAATSPAADAGRRAASRSVDYHTGGEPFRIVTGGVAAAPRARRSSSGGAYALEQLDHVRRLLVFEPRGHADMYGCHVVPPNDDGADLGVVFFHNAGYSTACGHGTIALVTWALDEGVVERARGREPRRRRRALGPARDGGATVEGGRVRSVRFRNVPSFVWARRGSRRPAATSTSPSAARSTRSLRERVEPRELPRLIELGREIKARSRGAHEIVHPLEPELRDVYGVIFWQEEGERAADAAQRDGVRRRRGRPLAVRLGDLGAARAARRARAGCRGATSSATCSIVGSEFTGRVVGEADVGGVPPSSPRSRARAYRTGEPCSRSTRTTRSARASCCAR